VLGAMRSVEAEVGQVLGHRSAPGVLGHRSAPGNGCGQGGNHLKKREIGTTILIKRPVPVSFMIQDHTMGGLLPPVFLHTPLGAPLADQSLSQPGEDLVKFGEIPQFSTWACSHPSSSPQWWISAIL
jgi:hypothetical protein